MIFIYYDTSNYLTIPKKNLGKFIIANLSHPKTNKQKKLEYHKKLTEEINLLIWVIENPKHLDTVSTK